MNWIPVQGSCKSEIGEKSQIKIHGVQKHEKVQRGTESSCATGGCWSCLSCSGCSHAERQSPNAPPGSSSTHPAPKCFKAIQDPVADSPAGQ